MKPYAAGDGWTLYHGDCRVVLPTLAGVDAIVTDPPYGIGWEYASHVDGWQQWCELVGAVVPLAVERQITLALSVGPIEAERHIYRTYDPTWRVCWYRGSTGARCPIGFRDWESVFVWSTRPLQMHDFFHATPESSVEGHTCPKPVRWARWFIERLTKPGDLVVDPFCGSGTTGVACRELGRRFVGIELDEGYAALSERRIASALNPQTYRDDRAKDSPLFMEGAA